MAQFSALRREPEPPDIPLLTERNHEQTKIFESDSDADLTS